MSDRKHMKKLKKKRIESVKGQIKAHEDKIDKEKGRFDTTKDYWKKEIDEKFVKQLEEDEEFLDKEKNGKTN